MQEAHTRSSNRALVQMRINSVAHALELEPRVMLESTFRGRLFNAELVIFRHVLGSCRIETLAYEFMHAFPLARDVNTSRNGTLVSAPGVPKGVDGANP